MPTRASGPMRAQFAPNPRVVQRAEEKKTRPSREQREVAKLKSNITKETDKRLRTRNADKIKATLEKLGEEGVDSNKMIEDEAKKSPPIKLSVSGEKLFRGSRSFPQDFIIAFWLHHAANPCHLCGQAIGIQHRSIDHKTAWALLKLSIPTQTVCKSGYNWKVVTRKAALNVICDGDPTDLVKKTIADRTSLLPSHQSCNSSKSGSKETDAINPQPDRNSVHSDGCTLTKAE